ncbi:hypothetical protein BJ878DRAFT_149659 [Calycina marina]|uniref:Uncharacterized protein n=1 Tax=Calycina marina TaxID=1763456 RepID=A0A9P7YZF2_9HELO|nr:hypothetical protein BJ878DRAFT_149659 [Calycina marina]
MASRSFKPASYLSNAPSPGLKPTTRPPFSRSHSNSSAQSTHSATSDDSLLFTLRITDDTQKSDAGQPQSPSSTQGSTSDDPARKKSMPIPIASSISRERAYTPLSARGDLPSGYFPNHEPSLKPKSFFPYSQSQQQRAATGSSSRTKHQSSLSYSPQSRSDSYPKDLHFSTYDGLMTDTTPRSESAQKFVICEVEYASMLPVPVKAIGKYHPNNFALSPKAKLPTPRSAPRSMPTDSLQQGARDSQTLACNTRAGLTMNNLYIPSKAFKNKTQGEGHHERKSSDVKKQLHQYQKDVIATAKHAQIANGFVSTKPESPKLQPIGSPGPITPFLLENEGAGYIMAKTASKENSNNGHKSPPIAA